MYSRQAEKRERKTKKKNKSENPHWNRNWNRVYCCIRARLRILLRPISFGRGMYQNKNRKKKKFEYPQINKQWLFRCIEPFYLVSPVVRLSHHHHLICLCQMQCNALLHNRIAASGRSIIIIINPISRHQPTVGRGEKELGAREKDRVRSTEQWQYGSKTTI